MSVPSDDPSPWGGEHDPWADEPFDSAAEQIRQAGIEQQEIRLEEHRNEFLWERYAHRMTKNGTLIR